MGTRAEDWPALLDRLVVGDHLAFLRINRLITGFLVQLRAYDFRDEWDDLRQEVVLSIVASARAGRLRDPQAFVGYVRIITRNKVMDRLKTRLRTREGERVPWEDETAAGADRSDEARAEDVRTVWAVVETLSEEQQQVLDGVYRQGKTYEAVSHETGIPLGTMKRRLRDALVALRRRFEDDRTRG
jgi:RNA polymerase sigma-70 factor (ECF subfamily)